MQLENALRLALEHHRPALVCDADANGLQALLNTLAAPRPVVLVDYRDHVPINVQKELEGRMQEDQLVHIAIGARLHVRLLRALWELHDSGAIFKGAVLLSTAARHATELPFTDANQRAELFPTLVGSGDHTLKWVPPSFRQAVVLVHGIGEQRPGRPLRSFADAVLPERKFDIDGKKYSSAYDEVSFDYRKLIAETREETQSDCGLYASKLTPRNTDFFEYYWAPKVEETTWQQVVRWLLRLLRRKPDSHLVAVWVFSWLLVATGFLAAVMGVAAWFTGLIDALPSFAVSIVSWFCLGIFETIVLGYLGDAARYLDDHPSNDEIRTQIRRGCVELLRTLIIPSDDESKYDRIVVVGHSLGSIIAYDALKHLWETEFWKVFDADVPDPRQLKLKEYEETALTLSPESDDQAMVRYQQKQIELLGEFRFLGSPWTVTDLITLGSPLAHASSLVPDFVARRADGELPENPPKFFGERVALPADFIEGQPRIPLRNGLFAVTRWTNIYFPARMGLFGDFVGGPLRHLFGNGIRDRKVATGSVLRDLTLLGHVSYWHAGTAPRGSRNKATALDVLIDALDLNGERLGIPRVEYPAWYSARQRRVRARANHVAIS